RPPVGHTPERSDPPLPCSPLVDSRAVAPSGLGREEPVVEIAPVPDPVRAAGSASDAVAGSVGSPSAGSGAADSGSEARVSTPRFSPKYWAMSWRTRTPVREYLRMHWTARTPSFQPIFLPSS